MKKSVRSLLFVSLLVSQTLSAAPMCKGLFNKAEVTTLVENIDLNQVISEETVGSESPVDVAPRLAKLRTELLSQVGPTVDRKTRETNVKKMESFLRAEAFKSSVQISRQTGTLKYDAVIIGTGPHAIFSLTGLLKKNPNARVLILSKEDTAGATFREGYVFNINSSNKPSGNGTQPLPGLGNINELPNLPIQVSDLTSVRYPEAADLGDALVANTYALLKAYKNIDLVFDSEVDKTNFNRLALSTARGKASFLFSMAEPMSPLKTVNRIVEATSVISATGLGTPKPIDEFIRSAYDKKLLRKIKSNGLATVLTFEEFVRLMGDTDKPWELLKDLKIAVVAPGDSGNVTMEFLLGLAAQSAYGSSATQEKVLKQIAWVGQPLTTCKDFLDKIRNRYSGISSGYKTSDTSVETPLQAYPQKLLEIQGNVNNGNLATLVLDGQTAGPGSNFVPGFPYQNPTLKVNLVILANGFDKFPADVDSKLKELKGTTTVSNGSQVLIAKTNGSNNLFITGPSVRLPTPDELKGVIQNFVSLFNNAPRSSATGQFVGTLTKNGVDVDSKVNFNDEIIPSKRNSKTTEYKITVEGIEKFKGRDFARNSFYGRINNFNITEYIKGTVETVLAGFSWTTFNSGEIKIKIKRTKEGFAVYTDGFENAEVIGALAYNRDFFSPLLSAMNGSVNTIQITATISQGRLQLGSTQVSSVSVDTTDLKDTSKDGGNFLTRVPNYIRGLFADQK